MRARATAGEAGGEECTVPEVAGEGGVRRGRPAMRAGTVPEMAGERGARRGRPAVRGHGAGGGR
ncbi:hypothetical protein [Lentzea flava]|uniref:hypothetical protein n=1 Tax=Lentzea flava TaxID=103732 RepID=UPI00166FCC1C|nr:hypothetical protein [Lentzea flava]MCP2204337.1 hypothetical protein [Lentzea flava]